jgi:glycosyltransferase involved in cell wall biosynthesis
MWYNLPVKLAKKLKGFKLILEIEEIYADVHGKRGAHKKEYNFFKLADAYLLATELLNEKINIENKPYAVIYGTYNVEKQRKVSFEDDKTHIVYAGTFDPRKGGAAAAAAAAYLNSDYHIHIIGFGSEKDKKYLLDTIEDASKKSNCMVTYDGLLSGNDYLNFLQKCQIGMSTQIPDAKFNDTSFPSKVLSYMANGLRVISVRMKSLEVAKIGKSLYYYEENTPQAIAQAIRSVDFNDDYDGRKVVEKLHYEFINNLDSLING